MKIYTFRVIVTEEEISPFWDGVRRYETPDCRWVKGHIEEQLSNGELMDVVVEEIEVQDV